MARALITGCSTGIGRAAAQELTKRGLEVVATARRPETLDDLDVAAKLALDVNDEASVAKAVSDAGQIDVLVNNAGIGIHSPIEKTPIDAFREILETNVLGAVRMTQAVLPQMRERESGVVVNVTSLAGVVSAPLGGYYSASKWALEAISESLHYEVGHWGIKVRVIEPGAFESSFGDNQRTYGIDEPPYDELDVIWEKAQARLIGGGGGDRPDPERVAQAIGDAVEGKEDKLRWPVGDDAELVIGVRSQMSFEDFEATMREQLQLDW